MSTEMLLYKQINKLDPKEVSKKLELFLQEDIPAGDATTDSVVPADTKEVFAITSREPMVFCGNPIIENIFSNQSNVKEKKDYTSFFENYQHYLLVLLVIFLITFIVTIVSV